jgi:hypothetical protein
VAGQVQLKLEDEIREAYSEGGGLVEGTLVHTKDGLKPIESIRIGDLVLSQPKMTGEQNYRRVIDTFRYEDKIVYEVEYFTPWGQEECHYVTAEHPFWVQGVGWTGASALKPLQVLLLADGEPAAVIAVRNVSGGVPVFNFEVEDFHTYYVGELGAWVHNMYCTHGVAFGPRHRTERKEDGHRYSRGVPAKDR